jgi:hypothetical protein
VPRVGCSKADGGALASAHILSTHGPNEGDPFKDCLEPRSAPSSACAGCWTEWRFASMPRAPRLGTHGLNLAHSQPSFSNHSARPDAVRALLERQTCSEPSSCSRPSF